MNTLPLRFLSSHLFAEIEGERWLSDTGAPRSFGHSNRVVLGAEEFQLSDGYFGLTTERLTEYVGTECAGLLGADVLGNFDHVIDLPTSQLSFSKSQLSLDGEVIPLTAFMGIPIVTVRIGESDYRMFFDTGAQISYFQDDSLASFPQGGVITDFYPSAGQFETGTYKVPLSIGRSVFDLRCGSLPELLGMTLMMAGTSGIIGNAILADRVVGYFPRRGMLIL